MTTSRLDDFAGSDRDYISYLEQLVTTLKTQLSVPDSRSESIANSTAHELPRSLPQLRSGVDSNEDNIQIIQYVPDPFDRKRRRSGDPAWLQNAKALIKDTPKAENWSRALKQKGLHEVMASGKALTYLLDTSVQADISAVSGEISQAETSDVLNYVRHYAQATTIRTMTASVVLVLANFQRFLVLSACAVLLEEDYPAVEIWDIARICIGDDVTDDYCSRVVRSAKYVNELIDNLYLRGWGYRSSELLLLCKASRACLNLPMLIQFREPYACILFPVSVLNE